MVLVPVLYNHITIQIHNNTSSMENCLLSSGTSTGLSPAFHCGGNARGNARVIKRTRPVPDSCVSMEAFSARVSAPVFDDLCVHLDLPRVYKCEMVSFQLMLTKNRARFTFTSGNSDIVSKFFSACGNARVETLQWKRFYVFLC